MRLQFLLRTVAAARSRPHREEESSSQERNGSLPVLDMPVLGEQGGQVAASSPMEVVEQEYGVTQLSAPGFCLSKTGYLSTGIGCAEADLRSASGGSHCPTAFAGAVN